MPTMTTKSSREGTAAMPKVGEPAPEFSLTDQTGKTHRLSDYRGRWVLLYFYPKDDTPGCTTEACSLRDHRSEFFKANAVIFGVSADSVESHRKFAQKFKLPFPLLADPEKSVIRSYGAWGKKQFMGKEYEGILRNSFLIDPKGKIAQVYEKVKPAEHAAGVLTDLAGR